MINPFSLIKPIVTLIILGVILGSGFWLGVQSERNWMTRQVTNVIIPRGE